MGYDNTLFNGKSMRNAIITKLSEDKHLTSALFANSNITILIDIISYMYQCLVSNLRQAASESMWSDTIFFENAARLAKLIGYYAKGQMPYTLLAKLSSNGVQQNNLTAPEFGSVRIGYGPYQYDFAVVEHNVNNDQSLIRLALGTWTDHPVLKSDGTKFQEFIIDKTNDNEDKPTFISQKYVRVFVTDPNKDNETIEWYYSADPLFLLQNPDYSELNADGNTEFSRTLTRSDDKHRTKLFNFYINENGEYVLKFGDGLSTDIPAKGSFIQVKYVVSSETDKTITPTAQSALTNASEAVINREDGTPSNPMVFCIPISTLDGYRNIEDANTIRENSRNAFSRQNRLVTKEDYRSFILENYPQWKDVAVQNNWEFISSFYGWLYAIGKDDIVNENRLEDFNRADLADANNIYIWVLSKAALDINSANTVDDGDNKLGIISDLETGMPVGKLGHSLGAIKDITERPVFLSALCKRFAPFAKNNVDKGIVNYNSPDPFDPEKFQSCFRIHVDSNYSSNLNVIKSKTYDYIKSYLFDNLTLGYTPNIPNMIKDIMSINGVINITTVFNYINAETKTGDIDTEIEVNGMKFCTWTDTNSRLFPAESDCRITYNLPNIPCFQYFKSAQSYDDFINYSLDFKVDYSTNG